MSHRPENYGEDTPEQRELAERIAERVRALPAEVFRGGYEVAIDAGRADLTSMIMVLARRGEVVVVAHDNSARRMTPEEVREAVAGIAAYDISTPTADWCSVALRKKAVDEFRTEPYSIGHTVAPQRRWRPKPKRCIKCNAIVPESQSRCPMCGGRKTI